MAGDQEPAAEEPGDRAQDRVIPRPDISLIAAALRDIADLIKDGKIDQQCAAFSPDELNRQADLLEQDDARTSRALRAIVDAARGFVLPNVADTDAIANVIQAIEREKAFARFQPLERIKRHGPSRSADDG